MFETTKLSPVYNGYQYLSIFIVAMIIDLIVHFFSSRKLTALKSGTDAFGFAPELMVYYRSLCRKGPMPIDGGPDSFYASCNSWLMGVLIAGILAVFLLLIADLFLQGVESYYARSSL
jgi:hypothetical protein